ncbi:MAG: hypothetical protein ACP5XB_28430 [Isosphaeraceae bacterium]
MPRAQWPLLHHRPVVEVVLALRPGAQPLVRQLIADTGAGTAQAGFELVLQEDDCLLCGGIPSHPVSLGGAYTGSCPVYVLRAQIPALSFDHHLRAAAVPACPAGYGGIACFRFLNRFTYGNLGDPSVFTLET